MQNFKYRFYQGRVIYFYCSTVRNKIFTSRKLEGQKYICSSVICNVPAWHCQSAIFIDPNEISRNKVETTRRNFIDEVNIWFPNIWPFRICPVQCYISLVWIRTTLADKSIVLPSLYHKVRHLYVLRKWRWYKVNLKTSMNGKIFFLLLTSNIIL